MTRTILVVAAALALISFSPRHANASEAPWCAVYSGDKAGAWDCQYRSFEECYPNALAKRGFCNPSPYYVGARPTRSTGSPKTVALARNKIRALRLH